ncbi:MAG: acyltransferase family protein [Paludibacteraceae bacterium]
MERLISSSFKLFGLSTFTFLSGFVLFYQTYKKKPFPSFVWHKFLRLMVPCAIYALLYRLIFPNMMFNDNPINGTHLWYIPMIFLCIMVVSIQVYQPRLWWVSIGIYLLSVKLQNYVEWRTLWEFIQYFPIFYIGFCFNALLENGEVFLNYVRKQKTNPMGSWIVMGIGLFVPFFTKIVHRVYINETSMAVALLLIFLYVVISKSRIPNGGGYLLFFAKKSIQVIDRNSFAIYLLHQFFINASILLLRPFLETIPTLLGSFIIFLICFYCACGLMQIYDITLNLYIKKFKIKR